MVFLSANHVFQCRFAVQVTEVETEQCGDGS
jgi:hypothetical protein